ncbi:MAG: glycine cleavage system aminomethyltransferase GcvT [Pseudomonadota bacterium]
MTKRTALYEQHIKCQGKMVDFAGWEMPIHYGSQIEEHHMVRQKAGMFDVSHMTIVDIKGAEVESYLRKILANDVSKISSIPGKALYSCLLNEQGFVIDDLIVYFMQDEWFRVIVNSSTREKDLAWFKKQSQEFSSEHSSSEHSSSGHDSLEIIEQSELAMIAIQGPESVKIANKILGIKLDFKPFSAIESGDFFVGHTGYTGEDGYEIICPNKQASELWQQFIDAGVAPCGLGARDTLRLEAGMNLYGNDMDETQSPLESGLSWTVAMKDDREFIGRSALQQQIDKGLQYKFVGLILEGKGILRNHQEIISETTSQTGEVTSGSFSPTMQKSIAFARIPVAMNDNCLAQIRKKQIPVKIVKPPFVRNGKALV